MKKYTEPLKAMKPDDLRKQVVEQKQEIAEMRRGIAMGETQNYKLYGMKRREVARALTIAHQKDKEN